MRLSEVESIKGIKKIEGMDANPEIEHVYISDLLSRVMAHLDEKTLWITVQNQVNAIAVAELADCPAIIFVEGAIPQEEMRERAKENDIALYTYEGEAFELASLLVRLGS